MYVCMYVCMYMLFSLNTDDINYANKTLSLCMYVWVGPRDRITVRVDESSGTASAIVVMDGPQVRLTHVGLGLVPFLYGTFSFFLYVCMYVCMYVHECMYLVRVCICMYICVCMYACMFVRVCFCMYVRLLILILCMYVCM